MSLVLLSETEVNGKLLNKDLPLKSGGRMSGDERGSSNCASFCPEPNGFLNVSSASFSVLVGRTCLLGIS